MRSRPSHTRGFTLIEMLVVLALFGIMSAVLVFNYHSYGVATTLEATAQDLDLGLRQAQVDGTSVRGFDPGDGSGENFSTAYGVYIVPGGYADHAGFSIFAEPAEETDVDAVTGTTTYKYTDTFCPANVDCSPVTPVLESHPISPGFTISNLCAGATSCTDSLSDLAVVYSQTGLGPVLTGTLSDNSQQTYQYAEVHILSPDNQSKVLVIESNGSSYIEP